MNPNLLDLILFSEKRKAFLMLLREGPKNTQEILDRLKVPRTALLPQIKSQRTEPGNSRRRSLSPQPDREIIIEKMQLF